MLDLSGLVNEKTHFKHALPQPAHNYAPIEDFSIALDELKGFLPKMLTGKRAKANNSPMSELFPVNETMYTMRRTFRTLLSSICYSKPSLSKHITSDRGESKTTLAHSDTFEKSPLSAVAKYLDTKSLDRMASAALALALIYDTNAAFFKGQRNKGHIDPNRVTSRLRMAAISTRAAQLQQHGIARQHFDKDLTLSLTRIRNRAAGLQKKMGRIFFRKHPLQLVSMS